MHRKKGSGGFTYGGEKLETLREKDVDVDDVSGGEVLSRRENGL